MLNMGFATPSSSSLYDQHTKIHSSCSIKPKTTTSGGSNCCL
uniref:Uncharacterized protein n=1 Tax=Brassica campestris TaxID=3711 RepID=A0A3P5ZBU4_BRACM|nr:unnamed protein product [Brassica rapa]